MGMIEAIMWLSIIRRAQQGNLEAMEQLQVENKIRQENNQQSVEEELKIFAENLRK